MWELLKDKDFLKAMSVFVLFAGIGTAFIFKHGVRQDYDSYADIPTTTSYHSYVTYEEPTSNEVIDYMRYVLEQHETQQITLENPYKPYTDSFVCTVENEPSEFERVAYEGFIITYYCGCSKCCGKWAEYHLTSSGTTPTEGRTIAADTSIFPYGTVIEINGHEYIVEDTGSSIKGNRIDIYLDSHEEALQRGVDYDVTVYVIGGGQ